MEREIFRRDIERAQSEGPVNGNVDATDAGPIHARVGNKIAAKSITAIFMGCLISIALFSGAIILGASSGGIIKILSKKHTCKCRSTIPRSLTVSGIAHRKENIARGIR
jgi:hypothetical protein